MEQPIDYAKIIRLLEAVGYGDSITEKVIEQARAEAREGYCAKCEGCGGTVSSEEQGDELWTATVYFFDACPACIGDGKCPGCGYPADDVLKELDGFVCPVCLWEYEPENPGDFDEPDWGDYGEE